MKCREGGGEGEEVLAVSRPQKASGADDITDMSNNAQIAAVLASSVGPSAEGLTLACRLLKQLQKVELYESSMKNLPKDQANKVRESANLGVSSTTASRTDGANCCVHPRQFDRQYAEEFQKDTAERSRKEGLDEVIAEKKQVRHSGAAMLSALLVSYWVGVGSSPSTCNALQAVYRSSSRIPRLPFLLPSLCMSTQIWTGLLSGVKDWMTDFQDKLTTRCKAKPDEVRNIIRSTLFGDTSADG